MARINSGLTLPEMSGLSLSGAEIQAISDYLASLNPPPPPPGPSDGPTLYANNCAGCHGAGDASTKTGADVIRINNGISSVGTMNYLSSVLSTADIQAIADYLATLTPPPPPPGPSDGATLYANNCAGCHGTGDSSAKAGADVTRISNGIADEPSMSGLSSLTAADIQAIADFLATSAPPTTPQGLYEANCGSCHGLDALGGSSGKDVVGDSSSKVAKAINKEQEMQFLGFLTANEVQLIADYLAGDIQPPPPTGTDGASLYANNCAGCHGAGDSSTKAGADVTRINAGLSLPVMSGVSLTATEIQAIVDFLATSTPPPTGTDGASLYAANCASCHGAGDSSAKAGATFTRISNGITAIGSMNYLSGVLSTADIQAITDFLATTAPPSTPEGLYVTYCASCHGVDARGGSSDKDVRGDSRKKIAKAINDEKEMRYLDFLSSQEIRDIATYLNNL
ncbi:MAG: hypothetical protein GY794_25820 [bacterium]|nr:hypothetical protein [bacterium]